MLKRLGHNRVQISCNTLSAYHAQHVMSHMLGYEGAATLLSLTELKLHLLLLFFLLKGGRAGPHWPSG